MNRRAWPHRWQPEAIAAVEPYVGSEYLAEISFGDPSDPLSVSVIAGYIYDTDDGLRIIHDRSGRPDVYPWPLLDGPVLRAAVRLPTKRRAVIFQHPDWQPPDRS